MNLHEDLMAKCTTSGRYRKSRKLNVVTIQPGVSRADRKPSRKRCCFDSSSNSTDLNWQDNTKYTVTEFSTFETSRTLNSSDFECKIILAITHGRGEASCEVGMAAINIARPELTLCQISDTQSYVNVLTKINVFNPVEILVPITMSSSRLTDKIKEQFPDVKIVGVPRSSFNNVNGMQFVRKICAVAWNSIILIVQYKYYALTAVSALLSYIENNLYIFYAKESMKVDYQESEGYMIVDVFTADKLELVACALPDMNPKYSSLFGVLNNCVTKIGSRTLRATILQPPCSVPDIEARLDCVEELAGNEGRITTIQEMLRRISRVDQLMTLATVMPERAQSCSAKQLNYVLLLNSLFDVLSPLSEMFENSKLPFFIELRDTLECKQFTKLRDLVRSVVHEDARPAVGEKGTTERCFAIKTGINPILDIIRKKYSERLDQMRDYVQNLGTKFALDLKLENNTKKGYHLTLKLSKNQQRGFKLSSLPEEFIRVERLTTMVTMTTTEILTYAARLDDVLIEVLKISNIIIYNILLEVQKSIGLFYKLCEDIAKLDMLQSMAQASSGNHRYVRPKFGEFTEVIDSRHPLLDYLCQHEPISNNILASPRHNMNIITGPNGSGKSIYIRQIVLLQIMAQIGCFVPATSAIFRVADRVLARIYLEDDMNCGASAFVLEMKEIKYFLTVLTKNTLIIIDELCRSTSVMEGTALAMTICERLLASSAFTFFTTHYTFIAKLHDMYYNIKCWQLEATEILVGDNKRLKFTYNILPGVTSLEEYAIHLAKSSWNEVIIKDVEDILQYLKARELRGHVIQVDPRLRLKYDLEADFQILNYKRQLTFGAIREGLLAYQKDMLQLDVVIDWNDNSDLYQASESGANDDPPSNNSTFHEALCPDVVYSEASDSHVLVFPNYNTQTGPQESTGVNYNSKEHGDNADHNDRLTPVETNEGQQDLIVVSETMCSQTSSTHGVQNEFSVCNFNEEGDCNDFITSPDQYPQIVQNSSINLNLGENSEQHNIVVMNSNLNRDNNTPPIETIQYPQNSKIIFSPTNSNRNVQRGENNFSPMNSNQNVQRGHHFSPMNSDQNVQNRHNNFSPLSLDQRSKIGRNSFTSDQSFQAGRENIVLTSSDHGLQEEQDISVKSLDQNLYRRNEKRRGQNDFTPTRSNQSFQHESINHSMNLSQRRQMQFSIVNSDRNIENNCNLSNAHQFLTSPSHSNNFAEVNQFPVEVPQIGSYSIPVIKSGNDLYRSLPYQHHKNSSSPFKSPEYKTCRETYQPQTTEFTTGEETNEPMQIENLDVTIDFQMPETNVFENKGESKELETLLFKPGDGMSQERFGVSKLFSFSNDARTNRKLYEASKNSTPFVWGHAFNFTPRSGSRNSEKFLKTPTRSHNTTLLSENIAFSNLGSEICLSGKSLNASIEVGEPVGVGSQSLFNRKQTYEMHEHNSIEFADNREICEDYNTFRCSGNHQIFTSPANRVPFTNEKQEPVISSNGKHEMLVRENDWQPPMSLNQSLQSHRQLSSECIKPFSFKTLDSVNVSSNREPLKPEAAVSPKLFKRIKTNHNNGGHSFDTSTLSINEAQFSIALLQTAGKTSTPMPDNRKFKQDLCFKKPTARNQIGSEKGTEDLSLAKRDAKPNCESHKTSTLSDTSSDCNPKTFVEHSIVHQEDDSYTLVDQSFANCRNTSDQSSKDCDTKTFIVHALVHRADDPLPTEDRKPDTKTVNLTTKERQLSTNSSKINISTNNVTGDLGTNSSQFLQNVHRISPRSASQSQTYLQVEGHVVHAYNVTASEISEAIEDIRNCSNYFEGTWEECNESVSNKDVKSHYHKNYSREIGENYLNVGSNVSQDLVEKPAKVSKNSNEEIVTTIHQENVNTSKDFASYHKENDAKRLSKKNLLQCNKNLERSCGHSKITILENVVICPSRNLPSHIKMTNSDNCRVEEKVSQNNLSRSKENLDTCITQNSMKCLIEPRTDCGNQNLTNANLHYGETLESKHSSISHIGDIPNNNTKPSTIEHPDLNLSDICIKVKKDVSEDESISYSPNYGDFESSQNMDIFEVSTTTMPSINEHSITISSGKSDEDFAPKHANNKSADDERNRVGKEMRFGNEKSCERVAFNIAEEHHMIQNVEVENFQTILSGGFNEELPKAAVENVSEEINHDSINSYVSQEKNSTCAEHIALNETAGGRNISNEATCGEETKSKSDMIYESDWKSDSNKNFLSGESSTRTRQSSTDYQDCLKTTSDISTSSNGKDQQNQSKTIVEKQKQLYSDIKHFSLESRTNNERATESYTSSDSSTNKKRQAIMTHMAEKNVSTVKPKNDQLTVRINKSVKQNISKITEPHHLSVHSDIQLLSPVIAMSGSRTNAPTISNQTNQETSENSTSSKPFPFSDNSILKTSIFEESYVDTSFGSSDSKARIKFRPPMKAIAAGKPMNKMTKREIESSFLERDLKFLSTSGDESVKYSEEIMNRPSSKQLKACKQVAHVRKMTDGKVVVCPSAEHTRRRIPKFKPPLKRGPSKKFDVTIFSDENSEVYNRIMYGEEGGESCAQDEGASSYVMNMELKRMKGSDSKSKKTDSFGSVSSERSLFCTPEGLYKNNREEIETIMHKYLK